MGIGIHGRSVGARVVDFVPVTAAVAKVRFRCITAMGEGDVRLAGFSAHRGAGPEGPTTTQRAHAPTRTPTPHPHEKEIMKFCLECIQKGPERSKDRSVFFATRHGTGKSSTENARSGSARTGTEHH